MGIPVLSFFTGGGFLDIGFEESGFDIVWTNESNPVFADMYEVGITSWRQAKGIGVPEAKISSRESVTELTPDSIMREAFPSGRPPLFGVIGGPPCVDFSVGGENKGANGINGRLVRVFGDLIKALRPDFFVMENVPGLWRTKKHKIFLRKVIKGLTSRPYRYRIAPKIISALELGVPQNRERLFVIGFSDKLVRTSLRKRTLKNPAEWFDWPAPKYPGARQLPWPGKIPFEGSPELPEGIPIELTVFPLLSGSPGPKSIPNGNEFFKAHSTKFNQIEEGDDSGKSFKRLHRYKYSPTAWYGNNEVHLHPWEPRRLSVREALRIQTVPDTYVLPESYSLTAKFKLIANGVPCKLANAVADSVKGFLKSSNCEMECVCHE